MFCTCLIILSISFVSITSTTGPRTRRADIDLSTCIENFDIHKDKIIRTQDSRLMGANYLNEIDLDSREECLRLCCETENCDVFVYEEKNAGSCYLFQCGPPEDFKCKFTHHVNYTSAVLAVSRHLPDLESQIKLTKHEQDLTKLRKPEIITAGNAQPSQVVTTTQATITNTVKMKDPKNDVKTQVPPENRKCSIYQFECRSTGECIAIYNACDGIPQCADGSDEAPELRCPDTTTTVVPVQNHPSSSGNIVPLERHSARIPEIQTAQTSEQYRPPVPQHVNPKIPAVQRQDDFLRPVQDPMNALNIRGPQYESPQLSQYQQYLPQAQNWASQQANQMPSQLHQYQDKNSHIFNHKDSGLQVADEGEARYNKYKGAMQTLHRALGYANLAGQMQYNENREYPKLSNYYGSEVYGQQLPQYQENWSNNAPEPRGGNSNSYVPDVNPPGRETWNQNNPVQPEKPTFKTAPVKELPASWKIEKEIPKHEQDKMAHELKNSKTQFEDAEATNKSNPRATKEEHIEEHAHKKFSVVAEYKIAADAIEAIEDGVTERPSGAILSLTLGVIITSLMGIFIGCRLRVVRRRLRRGGKSYAHDADYLVNGMYL